ncbi:hypothetical protein EST38_g4868 [Candolleomyces aberdarensis]|uniref:UBC core domain-containing protein n=1 Tax=Candolleomyces aberdarensis TaxID=2316362 RepID=A0A4Q2DLY9_9AGAR|nr:hypothetical protein EST38_g4868 [Candolleomyces aberdarensis]
MGDDSDRVLLSLITATIIVVGLPTFIYELLNDGQCQTNSKGARATLCGLCQFGVILSTFIALQELASINANPIDGLNVQVDDSNLFEWKCSIKAFVTFTTKIYHPGINEEGSICVPVLRDEWKPTVTLTTVLNIIQEKLNNPSPDDPFEPDIAALLKDDKPKFLATAKEWTKK